MTLRDLRDLIRTDVERNLRASGPLAAATIIVFRLGQYGQRGRGPVARVARLLAAALDVTYVKLLIGAEIPPAVEAGPGLLLAHGGRGVILNAACRLGRDVTLAHQVTLGATVGTSDAPVICDGAAVGLKASVIGPVTIGARAIVGAHALVLKDVPPDHVAKGVPASSQPHQITR